MCSKSQTDATTFGPHHDGYILLESIISLSLVSFILLILTPQLALNLARLEEGKEKVEMLRTLHDYSFDPGSYDLEAGSYYRIQSQGSHAISIHHPHGNLEEYIYLQKIE